MKTVRPWVEALGISVEDYQRWSSSVPADESVTFRCLREGRIPVDAYLDWARDHYGLAVIKSEFFSQPANLELFDKLKTISNWSREALPICEWDGVLFVACVEPSDVEWSYPVRQLLASPDDLEKYWNILNGRKSAVETHNDAIAAAETFEVTNAFPPAPTTPLPPKDEFTNSNVANEPKKEKDPFEMLNDALSKTSAPTSGLEGLPDLSNVKVDLNMPEGFASTTSVGSFAEGDFDVPGGLEGLTATAVAAPSPVKPEPAEQLMGDLTSTTAQVNLGTPEMPEHTATAIRPSTGVPAPAKSHLQGRGQFEAEPLLRELAGEFEGAMVLKLDSSERLEPWAWDSLWVSSSPAMVDLSGASAFRVVYRTKMPYMGHIVETPTNTSFFHNWGLTPLPEAVLIQPLIDNGKWLGMLVLKCDKNKKQSQLLAVAERLAPKFVAVIQSAQAKAA